MPPAVNYTRYTASEGRRRPPLWVNVLKVFTLAVVCAVAFTAGSMAGWLEHTAAQVARNDPTEVRAVAKQLSPARPSRPVDILVIGSD
ncbi:MAG TPA: hypothetical protein VK576_08025, partial [Thermoleophilia bacterium]|nr:hypothetical protein [Thermoleophilia bacterium]